jgi:RNA polymerase sigma-70 factor (ECF subfamily)
VSHAEDDLEKVLASSFESAKRAWPTTHVSREVFDAYLRSHVSTPYVRVHTSTQESLPTTERIESQFAFERVHVTDLYLACACARGDAAAIAAFEAQFFGAIERTGARMALGADLVEDLKQSLRIKLFSRRNGAEPGIFDYSGRGSLKRWFNVTVVREALSSTRANKREIPVETTEMLGLVIEDADPEMHFMRARYGAEFTRAFRDAISSFSPRERNLLRLYYLDRLTIDEIGALYNVHRVTAARRVSRVRAALVEDVKNLLGARLHVSPSELESVLRMLGSDLALHLSSVLGTAETES